MKKILILGAGIYQVPLIKKARDMGYNTIVSSTEGNYPGFQYADKVYYENTMDKAAILKLAVNEQIDAILTTGTDVAVSTIGHVCDKLNLHGITEQSALCATNKALMKAALTENGVRTAKFEKVYSEKEAETASRRLRFPLMFKCVDKSGSRGIIKVNNVCEVSKAFHYALSYSKQEYIVIEEFLDGNEIGVDGYIGEKDTFIALHDKIKFSNGSTNVPVGHIFPSECSQKIKHDVENQIERALDALNLNDAFFNADVMICGEEAYLIEIGARCGATCIPELLSLHYDIDYYELMLKNALGEEVTLPQNPVCASAGQLLISNKTGKLGEIKNNTEKKYGVQEIVIDYQEGDKVRKFVVGPDRIGHVIVKGTDREDAIHNLENAKRNITFCVNDMT